MDQYINANQNSYSILQQEYNEEKRIFDKMKKWFKILSISIGVFLIVVFAVAMVASFTEMLGKEDTTVPNLILASLILLLESLTTIITMAAFVGTWPAGFMRIWGAISKSGWTVVGGSWIFWTILLVLLFWIPMCLGPFMYIAQWRKVVKLKKQLDQLQIA